MPNLRPHASLIDLLFCMVMLFAFQMGQPVDGEAKVDPKADLEAVAIEDRSTGAAAHDERILLLMRPQFEGGRWLYREDGGERRTLAPEDVRARVRESAVVPVLVLDGGISLRRYLQAEAPLRDRGLTVEVIVRSGGDEA